MLDLKRPIVSIDLETTGTNPKEDRIIQIGIVKLCPGKKQTEYEVLINPGISIPHEITKIHGITNEMVENELPFTAVGPKIIKGLENCDICGFNVDFDIRFLKAECNRMNLTDWKIGKIIDGYKIFQEKERRDLSAAVKFYLNENHIGAHTALADAKAALRIIQAQLERYLDLPRDVDELYHLFYEKPAKGYVDVTRKFVWKNHEAVINFGKHKGKTLKEVQKDYLEWMQTCDFSDQVKEILKEALAGKFPKEN